MTNAKTMTNHERAKKAVEERWNPSTPKATHSGILIIAGQEIQCDVLNDGRRVLRQKTLLNALGRGRLGGTQRERQIDTNLPIFLTANNLTPYLQPNFSEKSAPINYKAFDGRKLTGYDATVLPEICKVYDKAEYENKLQDNQLKIAAVCKSILYGLATVGITALIDDATGYVFERERNELQLILEKYIAKELLPWTKKFPDEFFEQVYKLHGWTWPNVNTNHPQYVGKVINTYIYDELPEGILEALKNKNPIDENGRRKHRHHQYLSESIGEKCLEKQLLKVTTLMKVSRNIDEFKELIDRC